MRHPERSIMRKKMEDKIIIGVKQEDLEESIAGLSQLLLVLLRNIAIGNKGNIRQTMIDQSQLSKHFETAIDAMTMLYAVHEEENKPTKEEISNIIVELGMPDLIDRKCLKEEIESLRITFTGIRGGKTVLLQALKEYKKSILRIIDEQPAMINE